PYGQVVVRLARRVDELEREAAQAELAERVERRRREERGAVVVDRRVGRAEGSRREVQQDRELLERAVLQHAGESRLVVEELRLRGLRDDLRTLLLPEPDAARVIGVAVGEDD